MTQRINLTPPPPTSLNLLRAIPHVTLTFLDVRDRETLTLTCTFVNEFFQREDIQRILVTLRYPLSRPIGDVLFPNAELYARVCAANSEAPEVAHSKTLNVSNAIYSALLVTPDGKSLITTLKTLDPTVYCAADIGLYDIDTETQTWRLSLEGDAMYFQISPNEKILAVWCRCKITEPKEGERKFFYIFYFVDIATGNIVQRLEERKDASTHMQFGSDGETFYTGTFDNAVKRWDLKTGQCTNIFTIADGAPRFSRVRGLIQNETIVVSALDDGSYLCWDLQTGKRGLAFQGHRLQRAATVLGGLYLQISQDHTKAITASIAANAFDPVIKIWDLKTGKALQQLNTQLLYPEHFDKIKHMRATPDLRRVVLGCINGDVILIDFKAEGNVWHVCTLHAFGHDTDKIHMVELAIRPDGTGVVVTGKDYNTRILENKFYNFCSTPLERLAKLSQTYFSNPSLGNAAFARLPQFAQEDIREIQPIINSESVDIYTATRMSLHPIRRFLSRAQTETHLAPELFSAAVQIFNQMQPSIQDVVRRHFENVQRERGRSTEGVFSNPSFPTHFIDGSIIEDGIEAINRSIQEFIDRRSRAGGEKAAERKTD